MPEYTLLALAVLVGVVVLELRVLRTGLFRMRAYWIAMAIVLFFQVLMDGWLTKLSSPIVIYDDRYSTGVRFPFDIPVEDFAYGIALVTLAIALWVRSER